LERKPTAVWGIETPRLLNIQYAGGDYKFPLTFLSTLLAIALAPLIIGWLGAIYMTRQRELLLISDLDDYKAAFPHVLNFLPVRFTKFEHIVRRHPNRPRPRYENLVNRIGNALLRTMVIAALSLSMAAAYGYSLWQMWITSGAEVTPIAIAGFIAILFMGFQILASISQEWLALHGKEFVEQ